MLPIRPMSQSAWRMYSFVSVVLASLQTALRLLAKRWAALNDELRELDAQLARLTRKAAPRLLARFGGGPQTTATLLIMTWQHSLLAGGYTCGHRAPFDRMLAAQSEIEKATLIACDGAFAEFKTNVHW